MKETFLIIMAIVPVVLIVFVLLLQIKKFGTRVFSGNTLSMGSLIPSKIGSRSKKIIVSVVVYLVLLILIRELQPEIWNWVWERDQLFWLIQITFISIALIFSLGPTWTKWLLFPALMIVLTTHIVSEIDKNTTIKQIKMSEEQGLIFKPLPYSEKEIQEFLKNSPAPTGLRRELNFGKIKNLKKVFAEKVNAVEWSKAVVVPTPPKKIRRRTETVVLSGQVLVKNYDQIVGKYPDKDFQVLQGKHFSFRFKSLDHLETAVVVWSWEEKKK